MGQRGPIGEREDNLARPRARKGADQQPTKRGELYPVTIPEPDPAWHPIAMMLWESMYQSGQSAFYQQSDWAYAYNICEEVDVYKRAEWGDGRARRSPEMLKALLAGMSSLLLTEADRRRVRIELSDPVAEQESASVAVMDDYRARLSVVPDANVEDDE